MGKAIIREQIDGLMVEQVVRDQEYSMYSRHFHDSYELYFLLSGERYYFIDRETYLVRAGMAVLINRNQIHKTSMAGDSYHDRLLFQMDEGAFAPYMQLMGVPSMQELYGRLGSIVEYGQADWAEILQLLELLKRELQGRREGYVTVVKMLVTQILIVTARNRMKWPQEWGQGMWGPGQPESGWWGVEQQGQGQRGKTQSGQEPQRQVPLEAEMGLPLFGSGTYHATTPKHQKIREVADYLLNNLAMAESQEELASHFYVSKSYLCRIFKEVTGFTLNEYQNLARIRAARKLLATTKLPVTEIAAQVGFESITYFERVFKKHTNERPLQYRMKFRA